MWQTGFMPAASCFECVFLLKPFAGCWEAPGFQELSPIFPSENRGLGEFIRMLNQSRYLISKTESGFLQLLAEGLI